MQVPVLSPTSTPDPAPLDLTGVEELPPQGDEPVEQLSMVARVASLLAVFVPLLGLVAAVILLWGPGFSWLYLWLLLGGYVLTALGISIGYHRLFTHRSFETNPVVKAILGVLGSMTVEGSILRWVATHRRHHQHSDRHDDPHSPNTHGTGLRALVVGLYHSHIGWFFTPVPLDMARYVPDLQADAVTRWVSNLFPVWVVLGQLIPAGIALAVTGTWTGALLGFIWGGLVRVLLVHHITWSVNSVCHLWGSRPFNSHDHSRNNFVFGLLAMGEGWHNNHHAFPTSARHGLWWWQIDVTYIIIRAMEFCGLARRVRVPSPERVAERLRA